MCVLFVFQNIYIMVILQIQKMDHAQMCQKVRNGRVCSQDIGFFKGVQSNFINKSQKIYVLDMT